MAAKYDVFISYRREGGLDHARTICRELQQRGFHCFFDFNELKTGKFTDGIQKAVEGCAYFVLVLTDGSLDRCSKDAEDWVRKEIELALSLKKPIIPVCPSGNARGFPAELPDTLEELRAIQISQLARDDLFDASIEAIVKNRLTGLNVTAVRRRLPKLLVITLVLGIVAIGIIAVVINQRAQQRAAAIEQEKNAALIEAQNNARQEKAKAEIAEAKAREEQAKREADAKAAEAARMKAEADRLKAQERAERENAERKAAEEAKARAAAEAKRVAEAEAKRIAEAEAKRIAEEKAAADKARAEKERIEAERLRAEKEKAENEAKAAEAEKKRQAKEAAKKKMKAFDSL